MTTDINRQIAIGAGWMVGLRWVDRLMRIASIAILARLLLPTDFGLVAYALVFLAILDTFFMFSFQTVLIRDQEASDEQYSTVWTLEIIKGITLAILMVLSAKSVATFFDEPDVKTILYWIAATPVLKGLINIGTVDFQKNLELHKDFYFHFLSKFGGTISTLLLALLLRNYWALIYGSLIESASRLIISFIMSKFRPRLTLSEFSRVLNFSKWLLVLNIFSSLNMRLPSLVIGRYFNAEVLAFFNMGRELSGMASEEFAAPIRRALYPGITKMQQDYARMAETLKSAIGIIVLVGLPATVGIGITAPLLIAVFLGENWVEAAPIVTALSVFFAGHIFYPNSHLIYYAIDRPQITAYLNMTRVFLLLPTLLIYVPEYGAIGAAWSLAAVDWLVIVIEYFILIRLTPLSFLGVLSKVWRSTTAVAIMTLLVALALKTPAFLIQDSTFLHLIFCVLVGVSSYVGAVSLLWWISGMPHGPEAYCLGLLKRAIGKFRKPRVVHNG